MSRGAAKVSKPISVVIANGTSMRASPLEKNRNTKAFTKDRHVPVTITDDVHHETIPNLKDTSKVIEDSEGIRYQANL
jgi:hypothetical protein